MKFAHLGDCHLGSWRIPELQQLNFQSFSLAIDKCIFRQVDFVLITGDLFDSAYPPIEILKNTFQEFKKLYDAQIPCFLIAGSHDYSVSGKTFLDVLEKAGFCKNATNFELKDDKIILLPIIYENTAIYGYPGKKSSLEVNEIKRIKLQDAPGLFKILMLHTAIRDAVPTLPIETVDETLLPKVDYLALGHLHINYHKENRVYSGPTFPNNLSELEDLKYGSFYIFDNGKIERQEIRIKEVISMNFEIKDALMATEKILSGLETLDVRDKIVTIKLKGFLEKGKSSDIDFTKIESQLKSRGAFLLLRSTSQLHTEEPEIKFDSIISEDLEFQIIDKFKDSNPNKFNPLVTDLIKSLQLEKQEDETSVVFQDRLNAETKKILQL